MRRRRSRTARALPLVARGLLAGQIDLNAVIHAIARNQSSLAERAAHTLGAPSTGWERPDKLGRVARHAVDGYRVLSGELLAT